MITVHEVHIKIRQHSYKTEAVRFTQTVVSIQVVAAFITLTLLRDSRKSRQKMAKNTAHFCENRKNHGKITVPYIADNLEKN